MGGIPAAPYAPPHGRFCVLHMLEALRRRSADEQGQTMSEYSVVLAVITLGGIVALAALGTSIVSAIDRVAAIFP